MEYKDILSKVYAVTNDGLDILTDICPAIESVVANYKKPFRLRQNDNSPSAYLCPPKNGGDCWHVKDYGMVEGGGYFSPLDLYMWDRGYGQDKFRIAAGDDKAK